MYDTKPKRMLQAKSYTSIYDIFGSMPFNNVLYRNPKKNKNDKTVFQATCGDSTNVPGSVKNNSSMLNSAMLVTSEKYHGLNKHISHKSVAKSTSTIFYDLDDIAKRHSFNCLTELTLSSVQIVKVANASPPQRAKFGPNSNAIVQECSTQIQPKLVPRDSMEVNMKRGKGYLNDAILSSEIFLRDDDYLNDYSKSLYFDKEITDRQQKFWSYAKYRTEYTNPIPEEKKIKKKDRGKRTEDPCPCQLFSYACPCSDKKSLTELAKNSKSLTLADEITSTTKIVFDGKQDTKKPRKHKHEHEHRDDKPTNTSFYEKVEVAIPKQEPVIQMANNQDTTVLGDSVNNDKTSTKSKVKSHKKPKIVICPNCNEKVDIASTTEEEECLSVDASIYQNKGHSLPTTAHAYKTSSRTTKNKSLDVGDVCNHEPPCELVPVCQILPASNVFMSTKFIRKSTPKTTPRVIRITKACRHHPPCTVVPSCQRANVLKNNCEFIPPCLHRPRCVNLPLCVPFAKSLPYEELASKLIEDIHSDCPHVPKCKYVPECQQDPIGNNIDPVDLMSRVHNTCEFFNQYSPTFMANPKSGGIMNNYTHPIPQYACHACKSNKSNKSCQYDCHECTHNLANTANECVSEEAVMFVRDVGCQFHTKNYSPKDSIMQSKSSSASFNFVDVKMGNYYNNTRTVRYEDKFTSPVSCEEFSFSTDSITSLEIDSNCPSHGHQATRYFQKVQPTEYNPKFNASPYVTAFVSQTNPPFLHYMAAKQPKDNVKLVTSGHNSMPVKSRRSFLKNKYRKIFTVKRRKKSRMNSSMYNYTAIQPIFHENCE